MNSNQPIFVACPPRCGGSMIAGLIHKHGAYIGRANTTQYPGTNTPLGTENCNIKIVLKETMRLNGYIGWRQFPLPTESKSQPSLKEEILACIDTDGPWLVKTARLLWFYDLFVATFPKAKWVFPVRPIQDVVKSIKAHPGLGRKLDRTASIREIVEEHFTRQRCIAAVSNHIFVDCNALVEGNFEQARALVDFAGLKYDRDIAGAWVDPSMWHGEA